MGKRGPLPDNTETLDAPSGRPEMPSSVAADAIASSEWRKVVGHLEHLDMLSTVDETALEVFALSYSRWKRATVQVLAKGATVQGRHGEQVRNPASVEAGAAFQQLRAMLDAFSLTPSSRRYVRAPQTAEPSNGWADLLAED